MEQPRASILDIWSGIGEYYPLCYKLASALFVLPHSSVEVERVFSKVRDVKTFKRNRLSVESLEVCLLGYQAFKSEKLHITEGMLDRFTLKCMEPNLGATNLVKVQLCT